MSIELLASYWTVAGAAVHDEGREHSRFDFGARAECLGKTGFTGMGIWHTDLNHVLKTRSLKDMKLILEDNGITHFEFEVLLDWFKEGELRAKSDIQREIFLRAAEILEPTNIKIGDLSGGTVEMSLITEAFAEVCQDFAKVGSKVVYEMIPFAVLNNLKDSLTMIADANQKNGGFMLDTWHAYKTNTSFEDIAGIPKKWLKRVELNDGYIRAPEGMSVLEEATENRFLCGEGEFDLKGIIQAIKATGYDGIYGVEVMNKDLRTWPLEKAVKETYDTTIKQFS